MSLPKSRIIIYEDWTVVLLGFLIIALALTHMVPAVSPSFDWTGMNELTTTVFTAGNLGHIATDFLFLLVIALTGAWLTGKSLRNFVFVFIIVYLLTVVALILAGNAFFRELNLEAVIFSLAVGLVVGNTIRLPGWFRASLSTELFVKIGLVLLGTSIIFTDILKSGSLGLIQALIVVLLVWYFAFWVCKKLGVDNEMTMMLSSAVSICGVSAAIATAGAIKGDTKKLSYIISLVLVTAVPMMLGMPWIAARLGLSQEVTGAWLGGSIDTTGAVVASGSLVGDAALKVSTIVKFSQNVLLGIAAFAISVYWTYAGKREMDIGDHERPTLRVIWERFPKFVVGFLAASLVFSFVLDTHAIAAVKSPLKNFQSLWFALAFTSIGLETKFTELIHVQNRKPLYAFLIAQVFNILLTLVIAYLLFRN